MRKVTRKISHSRPLGPPPTRLSGSNYTLYSQPLSDRLLRPAAPNRGPEQTANLNKEHAIISHKGACVAQEAAEWVPLGGRGVLQGCSSLGGRGPCTLATLSNMRTVRGPRLPALSSLGVPGLGQPPGDHSLGRNCPLVEGGPKQVSEALPQAQSTKDISLHVRRDRERGKSQALEFQTIQRQLGCKAPKFLTRLRAAIPSVLPW